MDRSFALSGNSPATTSARGFLLQTRQGNRGGLRPQPHRLPGALASFPSNDEVVGWQLLAVIDFIDAALMNATFPPFFDFPAFDAIMVELVDTHSSTVATMSGLRRICRALPVARRTGGFVVVLRERPTRRGRARSGAIASSTIATS